MKFIEFEQTGFGNHAGRVRSGGFGSGQHRLPSPVAPVVALLTVFFLATTAQAQDKKDPAQPPPTAVLTIDADPHTGQSMTRPPVVPGGAAGAMDDLDFALGQRHTFSDQPQGQRQIYNDLLTLQENIIDMQRPVANAFTRYSTQSDKVDIAQTEISRDIFFSEGASRLRPGLQYIAYTPKTGKYVFEYSAGFDGNYRINDLAALAGDFWINTVTSAGLSNQVIPTYDVFLTLWPNDYVRIDIDNKRETFDNITSLRAGITAESVTGSIDYSPRDDLRLTLRGGGSFFTDSNDRQSADAEAVWRVMTGPTIEIGLRASAFRFSKQLNNGYFNPRSYSSGEAMFQLQSALSNELNAEFDASAGLEHASPGGTKPLFKSSLQLTYRLVKDWTLEGGIAYFSSRESNSSGFARTSINLGLHYKFD